MATTSNTDIYRQLAARLEQAEQTRQSIRPCSAEYPAFNMDDAYAIQAEWIKLKLAGGKRSIKGHKIGLTSRAMQMSSGIDTPDSGVLLDDMFYYDGAEIPHNRFIMPRIEVELGFMIGKDLRGPDCTIFDVLDACDYVVPALEIIDVRFSMQDAATGKGRTVVDTIADNACNGAVVIGGSPMRPSAVDLRWVSAICYQNGTIQETGVAAGVLGHPATGIVWLANRMATYGEHLKQGQFVMAGSFTRPLFVKAGDVFNVEYGQLGTISCRFK
jgi:2-oxo-hept-3-ene-1,7-dioate hydratase